MPNTNNRQRGNNKVHEQENQNFLDSESNHSDSTTDSTGEEQYCHNCGHEVSSNSRFCHDCGAEQKRQKRSSKKGRSSVAKACCCCTCSCCAAFSILLLVLLIAVFWFLDHWIKTVVEGIGPKLTGTAVTMDHLHLGLLDCRVEIHNLVVASPPDYEDNLMMLGKLVFDIDLMSALRAWLSGFTQPVVLEEFSLVGLNVTIDMKAFPYGDSNAQDVVDHMNGVIKQVQDTTEAAHLANPAIPTLPTLPPPPDVDTGLNIFYHLSLAKVKTNMVDISNVSSQVRIMTMSPVMFMLERIVITDVGKEGNGVHVYEFIDILVRAVLMAVMKGAPLSIRANLARAFGEDLWRNMNAVLGMDAGKGLEQIGEWSGWVTGEAALLPIRMAAEGASLTAQATEMGIKINSEFINTGVKLNSDLISTGAKLTGMGIAASTAITNAQTNAGLKAAETMARVGAAFTGGLASSFR